MVALTLSLIPSAEVIDRILSLLVTPKATLSPSLLLKLAILRPPLYGLSSSESLSIYWFNSSFSFN
jgi:hypothetical protein